MKALYDSLLTLFPADNFTLLGIILFLPLLGAFINGIWGQRLGREAVRLLTLTVMFTSFVVALFCFGSLAHVVDLQSQGDELSHSKLAWTAWEWLTTSGASPPADPASGSFFYSTIAVPVRFSIDALSSVMLLVITGVGSLIHLYASSYMKDDPGYWRFFTYLNLFVFSMLVLVMGDNLPLLFVGWEGVGLCSYLLIGFWYDKDANASAGKKAFLANRVGDFGLLVAMFLLVYYVGALDWDGIQDGVGKLVGKHNDISLWPVGGGKFGKIGPLDLAFLNPKGGAIAISAATAIGLALLLGATGKSAQIPLYVWLPDAMAGPTPVSALIHAATMVTAGVYLVCRLNFVFALSPFVMMLIAIVGAATALLAATIALVQNDLKKVLAYSTVSQLGFMFLGVGVGGFTAGFFHVLTHAFFKACLFLGAGSVIHAMHARIHDDEKSQDMRNMGGLRKFMPVTFWTFAVSTAAIVGFPFTSGFFSKDEILYKAFSSEWVHPAAEVYRRGNIDFYTPPPVVAKVLFVVGVLAATLTAFYMCRALFLTFFGDFRGWSIGKPKAKSSHDHHDDHHHDDLSEPGLAPHESPWPMTVPLIVLGALAGLAGLVLNPTGLISPVIKKIFNTEHLPMEHWLDPVFASTVTKAGVKTLEDHDAIHHAELIVTACAVAAFLIGSGLAYWMYVREKGAPAKKLATALPGPHKLLLNKWYVDETYDATVVGSVDALADSALMIDQKFIDFTLARLSSFLVGAFGTLLRALQNGVVHVYSGFVVLGLAVVGWFFVAPHSEAQIADLGDGSYEIAAVEGLGYRFAIEPEEKAKEREEATRKWKQETSYFDRFQGKTKGPTPAFGNRNKLTIKLAAGESKEYRVHVLNLFNATDSRTILVSRPAGSNATAQVNQAEGGH